MHGKVSWRKVQNALLTSSADPLTELAEVLFAPLHFSLRTAALGQQYMVVHRASEMSLPHARGIPKCNLDHLACLVQDAQ